MNVPQKYVPAIARSEAKYGLAGSGVLRALASAESSFNPNAKNSKSGAAGMFQFMPDTSKGYGIDPYDVDQAADAAGKMISGLLAKYDGDYSKALAGYNWGGGNVDEAIQKWGDNWLDHAPTETKNYIKKIMGGG